MAPGDNVNIIADIGKKSYSESEVFQENFARQQAYFDALQRQAYYNSGAGSGSYAGAYAGGSGGGLY
uniref:Uncharacterized protein n=1 Tax=Megaselia scalaris TaxID=36166 RepID=T1GTF5_MEGSC